MYKFVDWVNTLPEPVDLLVAVFVIVHLILIAVTVIFLLIYLGPVSWITSSAFIWLTILIAFAKGHKNV